MPIATYSKFEFLGLKKRKTDGIWYGKVRVANGGIRTVTEDNVSKFLSHGEELTDKGQRKVQAIK